MNVMATAKRNRKMNIKHKGGSRGHADRADPPGAAAALLRAVEGQVWEWTAPSAELPALRERHLISGTLRHSDDVQVRAVADALPATEARAVPPRLEDAYLYFVSNSRAGGAGKRGQARPGATGGG
jgi:hypothetical protein